MTDNNVADSSSISNTDGTNSVIDNTGNTNLKIRLELTDEVKQQEIVSNYFFDLETDSLSLELYIGFDEVSSSVDLPISLLLQKLWHREQRDREVPA